MHRKSPPSKEAVPTNDLQSLASAILHEGIIARLSPMGICYVAEQGSGRIFNYPTDRLPTPSPKLGQKVRFRVEQAESLADLEFV